MNLAVPDLPQDRRPWAIRKAYARARRRSDEQAVVAVLRGGLALSLRDLAARTKLQPGDCGAALDRLRVAGIVDFEECGCKWAMKGVFN